MKKNKVFQDVTLYRLLNSYRHLKKHGAFICRVRQLKKSAGCADPTVEGTLLLPNICICFSTHNISEDLYYPVEIYFLPWKTLHFHQMGNAAYYKKCTNHADTHRQNSRVLRCPRTSWQLTQLLLLQTLKPLSIVPMCFTVLQVSFISYSPKNRPYKQFIKKSYVLFLEVLFSPVSFSDYWSWPTVFPEWSFLRKKGMKVVWWWSAQ